MMNKWFFLFFKVSMLLVICVINTCAEARTGGPWRCNPAGADAHVQVTQSEFSVSQLPPVGDVITTITTSPLETFCTENGRYKYYKTTAYYSTVAPGGDNTVCVIPEFPGVGMRTYARNGTAIRCGMRAPGSFSNPTINSILLLVYLRAHQDFATVDYGDQPLAELVRIGEVTSGTYTVNRVQNLAAWGEYSDGSSAWTAGGQTGYIHRIDSGSTITVTEPTCNLLPFSKTFDLGTLEKEQDAAIQPFNIYLNGCHSRAEVEEFKTKASLSFIPNNAEITMDGRIGNCDREECAENVFIRLKDWQGNPIIAGEGLGRDYELSKQGYANPMIPFEFQFDAFLDTESATGGVIDVSITVLLKIK